MTSWADVCANPALRDLPFKIATNRFGKIVMTSTSVQSSVYKGDILGRLSKLTQGGRIVASCAIETNDGTKVTDVAWISKERARPHLRAASLPLAPEICIEVLSSRHARAEMWSKMQLYFERGASEVWLCNDDGEMEFFVYDCVAAVPQSRFSPAFPKHIDWD